MATLRNKRRIAAISTNNHGDYPRNNQARKRNSPRNQKEHITQVPDEIEGRVAKKLSQELNRTEGRILGAISRLD